MVCKRGIKAIIFAALLLMCFQLNLGLTRDASAVDFNSETFFTKLLVNRVALTCFNNALVDSYTIGTNGQVALGNLMNDGYKKKSTFGDNFGFRIPSIDDTYNKITETLDGWRWANCYMTYFDDEKGAGTWNGSMSGLFTIYGHSKEPSNVSEADNFMRLLGYKKDDSAQNAYASSTKTCFTIRRKFGTTSQEDDLGKSCINDSQSLNALKFTANEPEAYTITTRNPTQNIHGTTIPDSSKVIISITVHNTKCTYYDGGRSVSYGQCSFSATLSSEPEDISSDRIELESDGGGGNIQDSFYIAISKENDENQELYGATYVKDSAAKSVAAITNGEYSDATPFTDTEKYQLYLKYLELKYGFNGIDASSCRGAKPSNVVNVDAKEYYIPTSSGWCLASLSLGTLNSKQVMEVFSDGQNYVLDATEDTLAGIIERISKLNIDFDTATDVEIPTVDRDDPYVLSPEEASNAAQDPCYTSSDSLGWIICPVVKTATRAMLNMYNHIEEDFLVVESELTKSDSATRSAWNYFVNFANIAMVILLLVVIVSQITGAGIDNYGIKKLLPKIITVAILINLSFIICQLAVDVSNIVGRSLKDLLVNISKETSLVNVSLCNGGSCDSSAGWFKVLVTVAGGGIVGLGGLELVQGVLTNGMLDGLIIPILILILVAVIAVIFFFILLGLRKAAIVILIVISPLAFICYALPNTKKLFTKWFDAMKGLLLLYPLCGLVVGGGTLASKIILSASQDYVTYFIGTIIMVVPFFMIPSLLKSSFKALGGIGAKISGLGKNLRSKTRTRADKVHKNSTGYKARQADFANRVKVRQAEANNRRAGRTIERLEQKRDSGKELSEMEQARLYEATNTANSYENARADYLIGVPKITPEVAKSRAESRLQAQETKLWSEQLAKAKTGDITAEFENSLKEGNVAKMSAAFEALKNTGNLPKIHDALKRADWDKMDDKMRLALNQSMIGSGDVAMKAYAKNSFKHENAGNFKNFMEGVDNITSDNSFTIQKALRDLGSHALDGQNKDTVDFIAKHTNSLSGDDDGWVAKMIMSGLTSTQNGEEKAKFQDMLKNYAKNSRGNFAQNIQQAINAGTLAKLDGSSFGLINDLLADPTGEAQPSKENKDYSKINEVLSGAIADLQKANNATLLANLSNDVAKNLSVHPQVQEVDVQVQTPVQSQPQTQTQPQTQSQQLQVPHNPQPTQDHTPTTDFSGDGGMDG